MRISLSKLIIKLMENENLKQEIKIENFPKPVSEKGFLKILNQMKNSICKIYKSDGFKGIGIFCSIPYENRNINVMITNNQIIDANYIQNNRQINIILNDDKEEKTINIGNDQITYTNEKYDITIIEIQENNINYIELDDKLFMKNSNIYYGKTSSYIIQYNNDEKASVSFGIINNIDNYNIIHFCRTESEVLGAPLLNLSNNKIIGVCRQGSQNNFSKCTFLKDPINEFIKIYKNKTQLIKPNFLNDFKNSKIIEKEEDYNFIIQAILNKVDIKEINLLYQATVNGDSSIAFKNHCNDKGPTLTLIKTKNNDIFGGFTKCNLTNNNFKYGYDEDAFLFSISNKKIFEVIKPEKAIITYEINYAFGCFGNTNDWDGLYFCDNFLSTKQGYNNPKKLTDIYNLPDSKLLCNENYFQLKEMGVYQVVL